MKSILTIVFLVISFAAGLAIVSALYFAVIFGLGDYLLGVALSDLAGQALGHRVGAAASVLGGVFGALMGLAFGMEQLKRPDGGTNWPAGVFGGLITAAIVIVLLYGGAVNAFWAVVHYKYLGYFALIGFGGLMVWIGKSLKLET